ncbi:MAG: ribose-phosphate pyrophosphokinase [Methylocystis sp.]|nr:ribose-phosphate pyrophosphokinase [Methylocystis sp.]
MKLLAGNSNRPLAEAIAAHLGMPLCRAQVRRFADQEIWVEILENVRGQDTFVIQSTSAPANDHLMELLIMVDALRRASARRITAVIPYFGYARQDRKQGPRTPISAKLVSNLITRAGADRVLTVDLHAGQVQGFFDIPTDNLFAAPVIVADIKSHLDLKNVMVVSPDVGGVVRAVDSGGTLCNAAEALLAAGAGSVYAYITHGVLSGAAAERIANSKLKQLVVTDTIRATVAVEAAPNIRVIPIGHLIGEAIARTAREESVSSLFD